jgi:uncharacterized repeat protein (TIGR02543 family)
VTVSPASATVNAGASVTLPTPSRSGYTLNGWYTTSSGGTKVGNAGASYTPTSSITLYAQWAAIPKPVAPVISDVTLISTTSKNGLKISWGAVANATSYEISRSTANTKPATTATGFTVLDTISATTAPTYNDSTATIDEGRRFWYRIVAINDSGRSSNSTVKGVKVPGFGYDIYFPQKAANLTIRQGYIAFDFWVSDGTFVDEWYLIAETSNSAGTKEKTYHPTIAGTYIVAYNYNTSSSSKTATTGWAWTTDRTMTLTISNSLSACFIYNIDVTRGTSELELNMFME